MIGLDRRQLHHFGCEAGRELGNRMRRYRTGRDDLDWVAPRPVRYGLAHSRWEHSPDAGVFQSA